MLHSRQLKPTAEVYVLNALHPHHFTVAQTRPSFGVENNLQPKQKFLFSLSRRFTSTPKHSLEKFK